MPDMIDGSFDPIRIGTKLKSVDGIIWDTNNGKIIITSYIMELVKIHKGSWFADKYYVVDEFLPPGEE